MTTEQNTLLQSFMSNLSLDYIDKHTLHSSIEDYLKENDCQSLNIDSLYDHLCNNSVFQCEIIYYSNAIEFLKENDISLRESLEIASDLGYTTDQLNSETLATLLATKYVQLEWCDIEPVVETLLTQIEELNETN
jgi:RNAse (barnase) inhibitor barstar